MSWLKNLALGKLPQYTRKARHVQQLVKHSTPLKIANLIQAELALRQGKTRLRSFPYIYIIDPCNACDLRCPLCPTGKQELERPTKMMSFECFQSVIDQIKDYAIEVILHNWGESFLNPRIFDMIRYAQSANIGTNISSHFNNITDEMIDQMIDSGLENLSVSIDGASQEVYETYRVTGDFEDAMDNLRRLKKRKDERNSRTPVVEWQFIVMKHNEHEIPIAEKMAEELGVERFRLLSVGMPFNELENLALADQWTSENPEFRSYHPQPILDRGYLYDESCFYPYRAMVVNPDGGVAPCCAIFHEKWDFGDINKQSIKEIWNNDYYRSARSLFAKKPIDNPVPNACDNCLLYNQKHPRPKQEGNGSDSKPPQAPQPMEAVS